MTIKNIIFDFGGVLMDWSPRYFFKDYFKDDEKMDHFLATICTEEWNAEQDRGRPLKEGTEILIKQYPTWEKEIRAFYDHWTDMIKRPIHENVEVLRKLSKTSYPLYGLTNWSAETFPYALEHYDFFSLFNGKIVVSGEEKLIKPNPEIWKVLLERYQLKADESVFIDDNAKNIAEAKKMGFISIYITEKTDLEQELKNLGIRF